MSFRTTLKSLSDFFSQPYPFYYQGKDLSIIVFAVFVFVVLFNFFVEPFNVSRDEHIMHFFWISVIHSLVPIPVLFLLVVGLRYWDTASDSWNVGKETLLLLSFFLFTGIGQFLIRDIIYDNPNNWSWGYFFEEIRNTFIVGIILMLILIPLNFNRLYLRNQQRAAQFQGKAESAFEEDKKERFQSLFIRTQVKGDDFEFYPNEFIFARSDKNYLEIFLKKEGKLSKQVKRMTIKELDVQLSRLSCITRIHRSYLVNLNQIVKVSGNAQGYRLKLRDAADILPVSRNMIPHFEQQMRQV
ncbi:LytTR family DNA-binding domain-containing protein [Ulvibacterium sp.]|uniref:LytTR family DNA-binding domain-containing protein n=1 Tax=Ulvibacterium sp. TaxID=2665914 RepID=UPI002620D646|nr:LytTR family DNA-binding domain-containing protein [Ulvibacterium sp.]